MTPLPDPAHGRASAPTDGGRPGRPDYDLITSLRAVRSNAEASMTAAEAYDPDFPVKLSGCATSDAAEALLCDWLDKRVTILRNAQTAFRKAWDNAQRHPERCP